VTIRAFEAAKINVIDLVIGKRRAFVTRMAWLTAALTLLAIVRLLRGLLDDIARGRLGRVGRIFLGGGKFGLRGSEFSPELRHFGAQLLYQQHQGSASLASGNLHGNMVTNQAACSCASSWVLL
jgi:hypothetical protein